MSLSITIFKALGKKTQALAVVWISSCKDDPSLQFIYPKHGFHYSVYKDPHLIKTKKKKLAYGHSSFWGVFLFCFVLFPVLFFFLHFGKCFFPLTSFWLLLLLTCVSKKRLRLTVYCSVGFLSISMLHFPLGIEFPLQTLKHSTDYLQQCETIVLTVYGCTLPFFANEWLQKQIPI